MKTIIQDEVYKNITSETYDRKRIAYYFQFLDAFVYKGILYKKIK